MAYVEHNYYDGQVLYAQPLNDMDAQIKENTDNIETKTVEKHLYSDGTYIGWYSEKDQTDHEVLTYTALQSIFDDVHNNTYITIGNDTIYNKYSNTTGIGFTGVILYTDGYTYLCMVMIDETNTVSVERIPLSGVGRVDDYLGAEIFNSYSGDWKNVAQGFGSHAEGNQTKALGGSHAEGAGTEAVNGSHAEGASTLASAGSAHAEGFHTRAKTNGSHAEGSYTTANCEMYCHAEGHQTLSCGYASHAEGYSTTWLSNETSYYSKDDSALMSTWKSTKFALCRQTGSHTEGGDCLALGFYSHAEGYKNIVIAQGAHVEGNNTAAYGNYSHAEGNATNSIAEVNTTITATTSRVDVVTAWTSKKFSLALAEGSHVEGWNCLACDMFAHAEGGDTIAWGQGSHTEGSYTYTYANMSHAEGSNTNTRGLCAHSEGASTNQARTKIDFSTITESNYHIKQASIDAIMTKWGSSKFTLAGGYASHAEGKDTLALGYAAHSEGYQTKANGAYSHAEGYSTTASGQYSHAEGNTTNVTGDYAHGEGWYCAASGKYSHAEGYNSVANADYSHAEGNTAHAEGLNSHAGGSHSYAKGRSSFASGEYCNANMDYSTAFGYYTKADSKYQYVLGKYNVEDSEEKYALIIGNGTSNSAKSNAMTVDWNGTINLPATATIIIGDKKLIFNDDGTVSWETVST